MSEGSTLVINSRGLVSGKDLGGEEQVLVSGEDVDRKEGLSS